MSGVNCRGIFIRCVSLDIGVQQHQVNRGTLVRDWSKSIRLRKVMGDARLVSGEGAQATLEYLGSISLSSCPIGLFLDLNESSDPWQSTHDKFETIGAFLTCDDLGFSRQVAPEIRLRVIRLESLMARI